MVCIGSTLPSYYIALVATDEKILDGKLVRYEGQNETRFTVTLVTIVVQAELPTV